MPFRLLPLMLLAISLSGCGKFFEKFSRLEEGHTVLTIGPVNDPAERSAILVRGAMIYIIREDATYTTTMALSDELQLANKQSIALPNGRYTFLALGWDGASEMEVSANGLRCEIMNGEFLTGGSRTVQLIMSNTKCGIGNSSGKIFFPPDIAGQPFSDSSGKNFNSVLPKVCANSGTSGSAGSAIGCSSPSTDSDFNTGNRARAELLGYLKTENGLQLLPGESSKIKGPCLTISTSGEPAIGKFPIGNTATRGIFAARLHVYPSGDTNCAGTPLETINFPSGMAFPSAEFGAPVIVNAFTGNMTQIIINHGT